MQGACFEMAVIVMCILWGLKQALKVRQSPTEALPKLATCNR